jgi:hypothetical protein
MNVIEKIPEFLNDSLPSISGKSPAKLLALLDEILRARAVVYSALATLVFECDRQGIDLTGKLERSELDFCRRVASGAIMPELVARFEHTENRHRLPRLGRLPRTEQEKIINGATFPVAIIRADGSIDSRPMKVEEMDGPVFSRVVSGTGKIVPIATQAQRIEEDIRRKIKTKYYRIFPNEKARSIDVMFGDTLVLRIPRREAESALAVITPR